MALIQTLKRHALLTYFVLAYVLTWAFWIPMIFLAYYSPLWTTFWDVGNIMPSLVGILLTALFLGKSGLLELFRRLGQVRNPLIWYAVVLLLFPVLQLVAIGIPRLFGLASIAFAFPVGAVLSAIVFAALGEELGWRGFALPRMQARQQAFAASLLLGVLWGLWHLPLKIAVGTSPLGFIDFVLSGPLPNAVLFTWVYNNTKGSLFLMVLFHAVLDIVGDTILAPSTTWIVPVLYLILIWVVVTLVVVRAGAAWLSRNSTVAPA